MALRLPGLEPVDHLGPLPGEPLGGDRPPPAARAGAPILPGLAWLAFPPNAPYLITDLMYVGRGDHAFFWYDLVLLATFALAGCALMIASLGAMQALVERLAGPVAGWLLVAGASALGGVGIYLGRFGRWNSWDILANPHALAADLAGGLEQTEAVLPPWAMCALFAAFLLVTYLTFGGARANERR